jgi:hypothetical protein
MIRIRLSRRIRKVTAGIAVLALTWLGLAAAAPAAFAETVMFPADGGRGGAPAGSGATTVTRTVVVGGMPGWQIALIAAGAALIAAGLAVLADRARSAHRRTAMSVA